MVSNFYHFGSQKIVVWALQAIYSTNSSQFCLFPAEVTVVLEAVSIITDGAWNFKSHFAQNTLFNRQTFY